LHTIACAQEEIEAHKSELVRRSKLNDEYLSYLVQVLFSKISLVSPEEIEPFRDRALEAMREIDIDITEAKLKTKPISSDKPNS